MRNLFLLTCLISIAWCHDGTARTIEFYEGTFESAQEKANAEGKLLFVDFYASWCAPCKWMDKTTFSDPKVIQQLNEDFIPVKVNIDDFEGYNLKTKYGVKILPTVLIFNDSGQLVQRIEETISPSRMQKLLLASMKDQTNVVHKTNTSQREVAKLDYQQTTGKDSPGKKKSTALPKKIQLQLGAFTSYEGTLKYYNAIVSFCPKPILILHDYKNGKLTYRLFMNDFKDREEAENVREEILTSYGIDSFIRS